MLCLDLSHRITEVALPRESLLHRIEYPLPEEPLMAVFSLRLNGFIPSYLMNLEPPNVKVPISHMLSDDLGFIKCLSLDRSLHGLE